MIDSLKLNTRFKLLHTFLIVACIAVYHAAGGKPTVSALLFDVYIVVLALYSVLYSKSYFGKKLFPGLTFMLAYLFIYTAKYFWFNDDGYLEIFEFSRSIRFLLYLILFVFIGEMSRFSISENNKVGVDNSYGFFFLLICTMFFVYLFKILILGDDRPRLYSENNFEVPSILIFVLIFSYFNEVGFLSNVKKRNVEWISYVVSFLSLSKSGVLEALYVFIRNKVKEINPKTLIFLVIISTISILVLIVIFAMRMGDGGLEQLDRLKFFNVFLEIFLSSSGFEMLFGHGVAKELPYMACVKLEFWARFISTNYAYCNSTVFHSFTLKLVYDFGLIGLLIVYGLWIYFLRRYYGSKLGMSIFVVVFICSLSVSGFGNSIVIWPMFTGLFIRCDYNKSY